MSGVFSFSFSAAGFSFPLSALSASGAVTVADLNRPKTAVSVLREMKKLDEPTKAIIQQAVELLSASARENLPVVLERMRKEKE